MAKKKSATKKAAKRKAPPPMAMSAAAEAAPFEEVSEAFVVPTPDGASGVCPIEPDPDEHGDIDASGLSATQLSATLRDLASQGFVCLVWECSAKLWVRPVPPGGTIP
ncbi:MAG: hypothetical protein IT438_16830 [Phycisphaerales bacterium]|nr:hypothetical protein [Phycisphaerales bacterium]